MTKKEKDQTNNAFANTEDEVASKKPQETTTIYHKLHAVQAGLTKGIKKEKENKFQKYKYFDESDILDNLKPLLQTNKLVLLFSDVITPETPFIKEKLEKEWSVSYLKQLEIIDTENIEEKLVFRFWALGQNTDLAKAKGSAETYAIKYFLQKFFLIPAADVADPDQEEQEIIPLSSSKKTIVFQQAEELYKLFVKKRGTDLTMQTNFFNQVDRVMSNYNLVGKTNTGNFRLRLATLTPTDYQTLMNYLNKLPDRE